MKRRSFLAGGAGIGAIAATGLAAPAIAQNTTEFKMVTSWPKNFPGQGTGAETFARRVAELTDGRLTIKVFAAGELVPAFGTFDAVESGAAEIQHTATYYWQGKSKALNFFAAVPYGMTTPELEAWVRFGGGQELWDEVYAGFGMKGFLAGSTGIQMGGWYNKEINTPEDLKGLKMRIPGLGGEVMRRLGVTVVNLPGGEIYPALQSGAIDATEWVGPWNDLAFGFYKVAKHYYWPGIHEPGTFLEVTVNKAKFDALPKDVQMIFQACCAEENVRFTAEFNAKNGNALAELVDKRGVQLRKFPEEVLIAYGNASGEVISEMLADSDPLTRKVTESYVKFRAEQMEWNKIAEQAYLNARILPFKYG